MDRELTVDDYVWLTREEAEKPVGGLCMVFIDYWWAVDKDGRVAFFNPRLGNGKRRARDNFVSPQCNHSEAISRKVAQSCAPDIFVDVVQIPMVMYHVNPGDYI